MKNQIENLFPVVDLHVETDGKDIDTDWQLKSWASFFQVLMLCLSCLQKKKK